MSYLGGTPRIAPYHGEGSEGPKHQERKSKNMSRLKKTSSAVIEGAGARASGLSGIDTALDLGGGLELAAYKTAIADAQSKLSAYNTLLSQADEASNAFEAAEDKVRDLSDRMLAGVAARYGRDSDEYQMAGGTKRSERSRRTAGRSATPSSAAGAS